MTELCNLIWWPQHLVCWYRPYLGHDRSELVFSIDRLVGNCVFSDSLGITERNVCQSLRHGIRSLWQSHGWTYQQPVSSLDYPTVLEMMLTYVLVHSLLMTQHSRISWSCDNLDFRSAIVDLLNIPSLKLHRSILLSCRSQPQTWTNAYCSLSFATG